MSDMTFVKTDHNLIRNVLKELKVELQALATTDTVDRVLVEMARSFISDNVFSYHFIKEEEIMETYDMKRYGELIPNINRLHAFSKIYYKHFTHYWQCFDEGITLAKYDTVSYGESCITAIQESMRLEEKLFNLTMRDCIVK